MCMLHIELCVGMAATIPFDFGFLTMTPHATSFASYLGMWFNRQLETSLAHIEAPNKGATQCMNLLGASVYFINRPPQPCLSKQIFGYSHEKGCCSIIGCVNQCTKLHKCACFTLHGVWV